MQSTENHHKEKSAKIIKFEKWLDSFLNFEKLPQKNMFWLDNMNHLCEKLNHPENASPCIHIAGSKGKGSVSKMISCILQESGFSVGLYSSPHISDFRERISHPHEFFDNKVYEESADELQDCILSLKDDELSRPLTWFELVTLYSFLCFRNAKCDWNVFEVGLGGRLDATNVVHPKLSCITLIEKEHTEYLGNTLEKIATEKAGIIKKGVPVICARQKSSLVRKVFEKTAKKSSSPCTFVDNLTTFLKFDYSFSTPPTTNKLTFLNPTMNLSFKSPLFSRELNTSLHLLTNVQAENAVQASIAIKTLFPNIDEKIIEKGLSKASLPARFEIKNESKKNPLIIYDGAHTAESIRNTLKSLQEIFPNKNKHALFACSSDKDIEKIAVLFKNIFSRVSLTSPGLTRAWAKERAFHAFQNKSISFVFENDFKKAVLESLNFAKKDNALLLVIGSFYLVADVKKII